MSGAVLAREWGVWAPVLAASEVLGRAPVWEQAAGLRAPSWPDRRQPTRANWRSAARWRRWRGSEFYACNAKIGFGGDLMVPLLSDRAAALWAPRPAPLNLRRFGSPGRIRTSDQPVNSWLQPRSIAIRCKSVHKIGPLILQGKCIFLVATLCRALHPSACFDRKIRKRNDVRMAVLGPAAGQTPFARL